MQKTQIRADLFVCQLDVTHWEISALAVHVIGILKNARLQAAMVAIILRVLGHERPGIEGGAR